MAHAGGRPPLYDTPEQMQEAIDAYFDNLVDRPPTVTGLVLSLGFDHKSSLDYYLQEKPQFSGTIKAAKSRIEEFLEQTLYRQTSVTGIIFNLKNNFWWKDEQQHKVDAVVENKVDYSRLSADEMWQLRALMLKAEQNDKRQEES